MRRGRGDIGRRGSGSTERKREVEPPRGLAEAVDAANGGQRPTRRGEERLRATWSTPRILSAYKFDGF